MCITYIYIYIYICTYIALKLGTARWRGLRDLRRAPLVEAHPGDDSVHLNIIIIIIVIIVIRISIIIIIIIMIIIIISSSSSSRPIKHMIYNWRGVPQGSPQGQTLNADAKARPFKDARDLIGGGYDNIYKYIYIYREREIGGIHTYIYIYIYIDWGEGVG